MDAMSNFQRMGDKMSDFMLNLIFIKNYINYYIVLNSTFQSHFAAFIRIVILILILMLLSVSVVETTRADDPPRILFSRFDKSKGLSSDSVRAMTQDRAGNYWLATDVGLTRYDRFVTEAFTHDKGFPKSLSSNSLSDIVYDPKGNKLWIGTSDAGLTR